MSEYSAIEPPPTSESTRHYGGTESDALFLIQCLSDASGHSKRSPIRKKILALGAKSLPALVDALSSPVAMTRWESVNLLGVLRAPQTTKSVVEFALSEEEVHARWRSFWAVSRFERKPVLRLLRIALRSRRRPRRWRAALMLSVLQQSEAGTVLVEGLGSSSAWERWEALSAIKSLRLSGCEPEVARCLHKKQPIYIRQQATLTLGSIRSEAARLALARALRDPEPQVRWRASLAMSSFGKVSIRSLKMRLKHEPDKMVRTQIESDLKLLEELK